ncbi:MAG: trimeric intracellular cation channel family protein [bacterium]
MPFDSIVYILDLAGTAVFAVTGALAAMEKRMDIFGVTVLAVITALGGGTIRDVLMGQMPPFYFSTPSYLIVAVATALAVFLFKGMFSSMRGPLVTFDAIGLGVFTVIGAQKALGLGFPFVPVIILAMLTGIGGGMIRDVLRGEIPFVLKKEIYASASLLGAVVFYLILKVPGAPPWAAMIIGMACTIAVRLLSVRLRLDLPA